MTALKILWHDILLVWTFFTRIPAPHFRTERQLSQALWALPLIGLSVGVGQYGGLWLFAFLPDGVWGAGSIAVIVIGLILTGALHWDGLADVFDGLGVGKDRRQQVMRDPAIGSFGVLALITVFLFQTALLNHILDETQQHLILIFILTAVGSRAYMGLIWALLPSPDSMSQASRLGRPSVLGQLIPLSLVLIFSIWLGFVSIWGLLVLAALGLMWAWLIYRWLGGATGDGLGACQVIGETLILLFIVAM